MRKKKISLAVFFCVLLPIIGLCAGENKIEDKTSTLDKTDPVKVANYILQAFHNQDVDAVAQVFNAANRKKFLPLTPESRERMMEFIQEEKETIGAIKKVSEIRAAPSFMGKGAVVAKIRRIGDEVFVIVLTKEEKGYFLEDINSPSIKMYNELTLIKRTASAPH